MAPSPNYQLSDMIVFFRVHRYPVHRLGLEDAF
jgi:hypothetical protein